MLKYQKLPKGTPRWVTHAIFWLGGAIGIAISAMALLALYGISGFLVTLFFPGSDFVIDPAEAAYLGVLGVSAALSTVWLSFLGVRMNQLSRRAIGLSRMQWLPLSVTAVLVFYGHRMTDFIYGVPAVWVLAVFLALVFGGILPWIVLRDPAVVKVHSR